MNTEQSIIENNKLIAEFMGGKPYNNGVNAPDSVDWFIPIHGINRVDTIENGRGKILHYHKSWDWLMPVVQKINIIEDYRFTVQIMSMDVYILDNLKGGYIFQSECKWQCYELLNSVYEAVNEFIKWFNTQSK